MLGDETKELKKTSSARANERAPRRLLSAGESRDVRFRVHKQTTRVSPSSTQTRAYARARAHAPLCTMSADSTTANRSRWATLGESALRLPPLLVADALYRHATREPQLTPSTTVIASLVDSLNAQSALLCALLRLTGKSASREFCSRSARLQSSLCAPCRWLRQRAACSPSIGARLSRRSSCSPSV